ncbi:ankyrin repeat domain-containing protein [Candidatus Thiodiazotropha sp. LNASS1]|uniref:ankyrin repeat domain-containing protein n=1 Tax=Candidatus Thiodiazotropha sp. LNASS1 TaxID=3096260 RepID=UPI0034DF227B
MSGRSFTNGLFFGAGMVIGLLMLMFFLAPQIYLSTENSNFEKLREKSKLDCKTMPLHCLVRDEDINGVKTYIVKGSNLEFTDNWGRTALFYALWNDKHEIFKMLLSAGADANTMDENQRSVFFQSVAWDKYAMANRLLGKGADIDRYNGSQYPETALHYCVMKNKPDCVEFLLKHGADRTLKDAYGYTVYERVQMHNHIDAKIGDLLNKEQQVK